MFDLSQLSKAELYALRLEINNCIEQYESAALKSLKLGIPVKDYILKKGRKSHKIDSPAQLVSELTHVGVAFSDLYDSKLKGIPALEKLTKQYDCEELLQSHVITTEGKPTLVFTGSIEE